MVDRINNLSALVTKIPAPEELPDLCARVARYWAEIHLADPELAAELARKLPTTEIVLHDN